MIKILDFSPYYPPRIGGMEKYAGELHENLAKKNCQITAFVPLIPKSAQKLETKPGITIVRYPACEVISNYPLPCFWQKEFWRQRKKLSQDKYDIVTSTVRFFVQPIMACFFAKKHKIPLLHIEHGSDFVKHTFLVSLIAKTFDKTIGHFILSKADQLIAPSQSAANFIKLLSGRKAPVIYRGMPFKEIDAVPPENNLRRQFPDKKIIVYMGRLIYGKGIIHLLEAVRLLNRSDIVLLVVGEGPERKKLEEYAREYNLTKQIIFPGSVPFSEAISILKISDIFVNPSYNEGLPTSVLEAGTCKKAIIATNVGGTPEIITHNKSGIIIEPYDTEAIRNSIEKLIDDPKLRDTLGKNAREEIEQKFNWENSANAYLKEINSLLKK